jgi:hypothetical protein
MKRRGIVRWYEFEDWVKSMFKRKKKVTHVKIQHLVYRDGVLTKERWV